MLVVFLVFFFFQAEDGIRDIGVTGVQTCALPIQGIFYFFFFSSQVDERCATGKLRDSFSRACLDPDVANSECSKECQSLDPPRSGWFNQELGQCICDQTTFECNITCQQNKPKVIVQRNRKTGILQYSSSVDPTAIDIQNEMGVNDFDNEKHPTEVKLVQLLCPLTPKGFTCSADSYAQNEVLQLLKPEYY